MVGSLRPSHVLGRALLAAAVLGCSEGDESKSFERSLTDPSALVVERARPPLELALVQARAALERDDPYMAGRWLARATAPLHPLTDAAATAELLWQADQLAEQCGDDEARRCILQQLLLQSATRAQGKLVAARLALGETLGRLGDSSRSYRQADSVLRAGATALLLDERPHEARAVEAMLLAMSAQGDVPALLRLLDSTRSTGDPLAPGALARRATRLLDLGMAYLEADRMEPAIHVSRAYRALPAIALPERRLDALCLTTLALLSEQRDDAVIELLASEVSWSRDALPLSEERAPPWIRVLLADALSTTDRSDAALAQRRWTLELITERGQRLPETNGLHLLARARNGLARELGQRGEWEQALKVDQETFELSWAWLPVGHRAALDAVRDLAWSRAAHAAAQPGTGVDEVVVDLQRLRVSMDAYAAASLPLGRAAASTRLARLRDDLSLLRSLDAWAGLPAEASFYLWETILIRDHALAIEPFATHEDAALAELQHAAVTAAHALSELLSATGAAGTPADTWRTTLSRDHAATVALRDALAARGRRTPTARHLTLQASIVKGQAIVSFDRSVRRQPGPAGRRAPAVDSIVAHVLLPRGGVRRVELGPRAPIVAAIDAWIASIAASGRADDETTRVLAELVLEPVWEAAEWAPRLIVRAADVLHRLPLSALDRDGIAPVLRVTWVPDFADLLAPREQHSGPNNLLLAGVPDLQGPAAGGVQLQRPSLSPPDDLLSQLTALGPAELPVATLGLTVVGDAYRESGGDDVIKLPARRLTRRALAEQVAGRRVVHIGAPAWFAAGPDGLQLDDDGRSRALRPHVNPAAATLSGLAVASASGPPDALGRPRGLVTAEEIAGWDLSQTELVVLAAVDAAPVADAGGDRLGTLVTAFHQAGARTVLFPLWPAQPPWGPRLLREFYRLLFDDGLSPEQALSRARERLITSGAPIEGVVSWRLSGGRL